MTAILGLSAFFHDSAACLVVDGEIVAAVQEERFTRIKNDAAFPARSIAYCLETAGLTTKDLNYVAFYDKPLLKFERLLETYLSYAPAGLASFSSAMPPWLTTKLFLRRVIRGELGSALHAPIVFLDHHESHAASAFFPSPFADAAIVTVDGVGEWSTTTIGAGHGRTIALTEEIRFPHSLGLLYSAFTYYCGFAVNSGEYKLMGLAPYGVPRYVDTILQHLIDLKPDGSFWMDQAYFQYAAGLRMTNDHFHALFGGPPRSPEAPLEQRHMDLAASIQKVTEEALLRIGRHAHAVTGQRNLVMAGGVALNCVANGRLLREGPFERIWIQPAAGDAGGALGAALHVWHQLLEHPRRETGEDRQQGSYLGPAYTLDDIRATLDTRGAVYERLTDEPALLDRVAGHLDDGQIVGWFQGRAEFGPRALGARSILADPRRVDTQAQLNLKIKFREGFRPFAPSVLREHVSEWFQTRPGEESPYMLMVAPVAESRRVALSDEQARTMQEDPDLIRRVNVPRSVVPAVTHVDYSARIQTIDERHGRLQRLMQRFFARTGCPIVVNTSFNLSWEPIVLTPAEAYDTFMHSEMDLLVLEDYLVLKANQPGAAAIVRGRPPVTARPATGWRWHWRQLTASEGSAIEPVGGHRRGPDDSNRSIRQFSGIGAALLIVLAAWRAWDAGVTSGVVRTGVTGLVLGLLGLLAPAVVRPLYRLALAVTAPVGAVVSRLILAAIYYVIFTPVAVGFRLVSRDELRRQRPVASETHWRRTRGPRAARDYLRQS